MKLTNFQIKLAWVVGIGSIICIWIAFPYIFKTLLSFYTFPKDFNQFGAFGDIYGSLNTLISSIALCAVAFSTWLQVTSLKETRRSNKDQFLLTKEAHDEQIKESRYAIFANQFYSLLNFKKDKFNSIELTKEQYNQDGEKYYSYVKANYAFNEISLEFLSTLKKNKNFYNDLSLKELFQEFYQLISNLNYESESLIISYFHIYVDFCILIRNAKIDEKDKEFYKSVLSNSMTQHEQVMLFLISPMFRSFDLEDIEIFSLFGHMEALEPFAVEYHKGSHFKHEEWKTIFKRLNPT